MTIEQTVSTALTNAGYGNYMQYARPVITELVNREQEICGRLITFAQESDLNVEAVRNALSECGMHLPVEPEPTPAQNVMDAVAGIAATATTTEDALAATLGRIEQALSGLTAFARANGYNG